MFKTIETLVLASGSPRRNELLSNLGLEFSVVVSDVDEAPLHGEKEEAYALRMAGLKGEAVSRQHPSSWVVSADTVVIFEDRLLTKPATTDEAVQMLMLLSGRKHQVRTGFSLCCHDRKVWVVRSTLTNVCFRPFDLDWARAYVSTGEPMDKAGGYGIQGRGGVFVESISGSYSNVVGLPLAEVVELLVEYQVVVPASQDHQEKR